MDVSEILASLAEVIEAASVAIRRVYDINANRYDPSVGDDTTTFGINVYRNSWYFIEEEADGISGFTSSRPDNSLQLVGRGFVLHFYRHELDEHADLDAFRAGDANSATKQQIAEINGEQMLDLGPEFTEPAITMGDLSSLVMLHAGNPDDGCCAIWIGAPLPTQSANDRAWAWIEPVWMISRPAPGVELPLDRPDTVRHDELPEPEIDVRPRDEDGANADDA